MSSRHNVNEMIRRVSTQFQQTRADYVAYCSCGWTKSTRMGRGELGPHRAAIAKHKAASTDGEKRP